MSFCWACFQRERERQAQVLEEIAPRDKTGREAMLEKRQQRAVFTSKNTRDPDAMGDYSESVTMGGGTDQSLLHCRLPRTPIPGYVSLSSALQFGVCV